jgi:hypothetical protein
MKSIFKILIILITVLQINITMAADNIVGTWQGKLVPAPGSEMVIQFKITQNANGSYAVVLDSPDQGAIKNIQATSVVFSAGKLKLDVTELSGAYEGVLKNGIFEGNWKQEGTLIPLNLKPYEKPVLSKADLEKLAGSWYGPLKVPTGDQILAFRFEIKESGENKTFLDIPDSGAKDIPVTDVEFAEGTLILKISAIQADYKGKFTGDTIVGDLKIQGQSFPLTLKKGEYKPQVVLNIPKDIKDKLSGEWHGQLSTPRGLIHMAFRFETSAKGDFMGFCDVLDQNVKGLPINEANYADGKLSLKVKVLNAELKGTIEGDMLKGEWAQAGLSNIPLSMKKGAYIPPAFTLNLPKETKELLKGEWHGQRKMPKGLIHVSFRFETNDKGEFLGFYEVPDQNVKNMPVTEASLKDGNLVLKMQKGINIEFKGQLAGDKLTGQVTQQGVAGTTLSMTKGKYIPPVYNLNLPKAIKDQLTGEWYGDIKTPTATITAVLTFKTTEKGEFIGYEDVPDQKITGIPINEANSADGKLTFIILDSEVKAQVKGDQLTGEVVAQQANNNQPITFTLKKGKYVSPSYALNLPADVIKTLSGKWNGKLGNTNLVFRFEKNEKGELLGFLDAPDSNTKDIPISEGSMSEGKLILKIKLANVEYKGKLSKDTLDGEWIQQGQNIPLTMKKQ